MPIPSWFFAGLGFLLALIAVPLILRRVPPNPFYGLRVPATFRDENVWYDANAAAGRDMVVLGVLIIVAAFVAPALGARDMALAVTWGAVGVGGAMAIAVVGWVRAERMLQQRQQGR